jgi:hypothetical protein
MAVYGDDYVGFFGVIQGLTDNNFDFELKKPEVLTQDIDYKDVHAAIKQ